MSTRKILLLLLFAFGFFLIETKPGIAQSTLNYDLDFSTYMGGTKSEHARDVFVDKQGYIYVVGGTKSPDYHVTAGAYDTSFDSRCGACGSDGPQEAFVMKFNPDGTLNWSTFLGGPNYDRAYAVEVDDQGYVYVSGRAGPGFPTTSGSFQPGFQGQTQGRYGDQNAFVVKLKPDGSDLVWASYVGTQWGCRDLAIDDNGYIYLPLNYQGLAYPPAAWFTNAYQKTTKGDFESGVIKINNDGTQVMWATWYGGSGRDMTEASIRVDNTGVYMHGFTESTDIPTTQGAHDSTHNGGGDSYVAKFSLDGSSLIYATYIGGSGDDLPSTHNLAIDAQGNAYPAIFTTSTDFPTTQGAFDRTHGGGSYSDMAIAKISPTGGLIASTYIGGNNHENVDGIDVDSSGNVFLTGESASANFPVTTNAYQSQKNGDNDAVVLILSADFSQLLYSTFMGGPNYDAGRSGDLDESGNLYITGSTSGSGWPVKNAFQDYFAGGGGAWGVGDNILAKFGNISQPSPGSLQFGSSTYGVNENSGSATITVTRTGALTGTVTVDYSTSDGTATGSDYQPTSGTLSWQDGETSSKTFSVTIIDDSNTEATETVNLTLSNPTGSASLGIPASATLIIADDEGPQQDSTLVGYWTFDEASGTIVTDSSANGNDGTLVNGPVWTTGKIAGGLQLDGVNDYVNVGYGSSMELTGPISVSAWIYPQSSAQDMAFVDGEGQYTLWVQANNEVRFADSLGNFVDTTLNILTLNAWNHVVGVFSGNSGDAITLSNAKIYINGISAGNHVSGVWSPNPGLSYATIGSGDDTWAFFNGIIDDVRIYERALTSQEILDLYMAAAPTPTPTPATCSSDITNDNIVNQDDIWEVLKNYFQRETGLIADLNNDNIVNIIDAANVLEEWGCSGS